MDNRHLYAGDGKHENAQPSLFDTAIPAQGFEEI